MQQNDVNMIERLSALLNLLSGEFEDQAWLIPQLNYPDNLESAQRAIRRDIASLQALGFVIEEERRSNKPAYRLVGHKKWPRASALERAMRGPQMGGKVREG